MPIITSVLSGPKLFQITHCARTWLGIIAIGNTVQQRHGIYKLLEPINMG